MSGIHLHDHAHPQPHAHLASDVPAWIAGADARVKLATALAMVVIAVSTPPESFMAAACYFSMLGLLAIWSRISPHVIVTRLAAVVPFVALIALFVPFLPDPSGGAASFGVGALRVHRAGLVAHLLARAGCISRLPALSAAASARLPLDQLPALGAAWLSRCLDDAAALGRRHAITVRKDAGP